MKNVLYIGWIGYKNLGDELMFDLFQEQFATLGPAYRLHSVNVEGKYLKNVPLTNIDLIVLGGGSILGNKGIYIHPYLVDYLYKAQQIGKKVMIWGTGIDWLPKDWVPLLAQKQPIPFVLTSELKMKLQTVFRESVWAGVRGPLTLQFLEQLGVTNAYVSGDPAFLLKRSSERSTQHFSLPEAKRGIIGVNWGTSFNHVYGQNEQSVENQLAKVLNGFIEQGYHVYFYTVWQNDLPAIERLYSKISNQSCATFDKTLYHQQDLIARLEQFAFTINLKLHANYLSLAANTPLIALGYRFKVFDFIKSVDLEDYIISTDEEEIGERIFKMKTDIFGNQVSLKQKMDAYVEKYRERMTDPFTKGLCLS